MEQYIPKFALVAEIERLKERFIAFHHRDGNDWPLDNYGKMRAYNEVLSFINTLEVKEVDLEKLINDYFTGWYFDSELDILAKPNNYSATVSDVKEIARYFFELGLRAQHNNISIPNIDDIFEKEGIDPNSKDAKIFKECYYMALEKLKAQKGE